MTLSCQWKDDEGRACSLPATHAIIETKHAWAILGPTEGLGPLGTQQPMHCHFHIIRAYCRVYLTSLPQKALEKWEMEPGRTILTNKTGTRYAVGLEPDVWIGHEGWHQSSPEELETLTEQEESL